MECFQKADFTISFKCLTTILVVKSREAIAAIIEDIVGFFLQLKEFELYWAAVFFKICSHIFMIYEVKY